MKIRRLLETGEEKLFIPDETLWQFSSNETTSKLIENRAFIRPIGYYSIVTHYVHSYRGKNYIKVYSNIEISEDDHQFGKHLRETRRMYVKDDQRLRRYPEDLMMKSMDKLREIVGSITEQISERNRASKLTPNQIEQMYIRNYAMHIMDYEEILP